MPEMKETKTFGSIDEYIASFPEELRVALNQIRSVIKNAAPDAQERMSWQMPTFHLKENLVHFAAHKNHVGFYPGAEAIVVFEEKLSGYKTSKGAVQFPFKNPIPYNLIEEITRYRVNQVLSEK